MKSYMQLNGFISLFIYLLYFFSWESSVFSLSPMTRIEKYFICIDIGESNPNPYL